jgi:hypothetical protein
MVEQGSDEMLAELARLGDTRTWEPGALVVAEGDLADCMYIIHSGELRALVAGDGGRSVELNTLCAGEVFGELMLSGERRSASVQVTVRATLTRVGLAEVQRMLAARPDLSLQLIQRLVQRVRTLTRTVGRLASVDVYGRLVGLFDGRAAPSSTTWAASSTSPSTRPPTTAPSAGRRKPASPTWNSRSATRRSASRPCAAWPKGRQPHHRHRLQPGQHHREGGQGLPEAAVRHHRLGGQPAQRAERWCSRSRKAASWWA